MDIFILHLKIIHLLPPINNDRSLTSYFSDDVTVAAAAAAAAVGCKNYVTIATRGWSVLFGEHFFSKFILVLGLDDRVLFDGKLIAWYYVTGSARVDLVWPEYSKAGIFYSSKTCIDHIYVINAEHACTRATKVATISISDHFWFVILDHIIPQPSNVITLQLNIDNVYIGLYLFIYLLLSFVM